MKITQIEIPWIRVLGVVMVDIAILMFFMVFYRVTPFYWATVYSRIWIFAGFATLALFKKVPIHLLGFSLLDLGGGIWTLLTLI